MKIASTQYSLAHNSFEIYLSGCNEQPKCEGCYSKELWDFDVGEEYTKKYFEKLSKKINNFEKIIDNIFILGGEPLDQNTDELLMLTSDLKYFNKPIWLFTRYELEKIDKSISYLFDYIKSGKYLKELSCDNNIQYEIKLATSNQKIYKKGIDY